MATAPKAVMIVPGAAPAGPQPPLFPPSKKAKRAAREEAAASFQEERGYLRSEYIDCVCIHVGSSACESASQSGDKQLCELLMSIPGRYWRIGHFPGDFPVFRQEPPADDTSPNNKELFLFYKLEPAAEQGWYVATSINPPSDGTCTFGYTKAPGGPCNVSGGDVCVCVCA